MASRFLHDPKYALAYGLLALLLLLVGGLLFREAGHLRERAEGTSAENQLLLSYQHAERNAALALGPIGLVGGLFVKGKNAVLPAGSELYIQTAQPVTTKGLVLREGAPHIVLRKHVARTASAASIAAAEDNQVAATAVTETASPAPKAEISDSAKAELEAAREKDSTVKETADSAKTNNEAASVVIMRNE